MLLGIENPRAGGDAGTGDADIRAERLTFSLGDFKLAQGQTVRLHVLAAFADGSMQDVTPTATYSSDNAAAVTFGGPGLVNGGTQPGTATITARLGSAIPATLTATVTAATCHPVINELLVEGLTSTADEWVEIFNPCTNAIDVKDWTLVYRAATNVSTVDDTLLFTFAGPLASGEIRLLAGEGYSGPNDGTWAGTSGQIGGTRGAVGLRSGDKDAGALVDAIAYGAVTSGHPFIETAAIPAMVNGRSASRLPFDGKDDNDGAVDFKIVMTPTPRALNVP